MIRCSYCWETRIVFMHNDFKFSGRRSVNFVVNNICGNINQIKGIRVNSTFNKISVVHVSWRLRLNLLTE
jgi:hypothetical protein